MLKYRHCHQIVTNKEDMLLDKLSFQELYTHSQEDIKNKINTLLDIVKQYSPLTILKRCYEEIMRFCVIYKNQSANPDFEILLNILPLSSKYRIFRKIK